MFPVEPAGKFLEKSLRSQKRLWPNPPQFLDTIADAIRTQQVRVVMLGLLLTYWESLVCTIDAFQKGAYLVNLVQYKDDQPQY